MRERRGQSVSRSVGQLAGPVMSCHVMSSTHCFLTCVLCCVAHADSFFRCVHTCAAYIVTSTRQVYSWGGNSFWWHEIQPDSIYQSKWRGDVTPRSQLLLGKDSLVLPVDAVADGESDEAIAENMKVEWIKVRKSESDVQYMHAHLRTYCEPCPPYHLPPI